MNKSEESSQGIYIKIKIAFHCVGKKQPVSVPES